MENLNQGGFRKFAALAGAFFLAWGIIRYFLPLIAPFLLGWIFAFVAEPMTAFLHRRLKLGRGFSAAVSVSLVLTLLVGLVWLVGALCYRELAALAAGLPVYADALSGRVSALRDWALGLVSRAPGGLGTLLGDTVKDLFAGGSVLLNRVASGALSAAGNVAGKLPGGALLIGTAIVSAYMIAAQYPALKRRVSEGLHLRDKWEPTLRRLGQTVGLWLKAQVKLTAVTLAIVGAGFLLLRVDHWLLWAVLTAIVDAIPMLGTGTVLIPMALFAFLWGENVRGIGLLGLYVTAMLSRSALEPRLVGRQLGMNPLTTLMALYAGFRIWGVPGMILSPILAVTVTQLLARGD